MEDLPWQDNTFDLVTGFNSFFFANDMAAALREAGRVAKPNAHVVIQVWETHDRCDLEAMKQIARPFPPPRPADAPPDPDLSEAGTLEAIAARAGLIATGRPRLAGRALLRGRGREAPVRNEAAQAA